LTVNKEVLNINGRTLYFSDIEQALFEFGKNRNWDSKLAKWTRTGRTSEQSLLAHSLNTYSVAKKLSLRFASDLGLSDLDILLALIASFAHDQGKERDGYQESTKRAKVEGHCPIQPDEIADLKNCMRSILTSTLSLNLENQDLESSLDIIFTSAAEHMKSEYNLARAVKLLSSGHIRNSWINSIVISADTIASWKALEDSSYSRLTLIEDRAQIFYHKLARIRGLLSYALHTAIEKLAKQRGAEILLTYPNGTLYSQGLLQKILVIFKFIRDRIASNSVSSNFFWQDFVVFSV
jgi:CRISPR type I-D-associated protein Csc3/Cas10d